MSSQTETASGIGVVRRYPLDLAVCTGLAAICWYAVRSLPAGSRLRIAFALPLLCLLPGFAVVATLFPGSADRGRTQGGRGARAGGITILERFALSFALSLATLPVIVLVLGITSAGLAANPATTAVAVVAIVGSQVGVWRRWQVPEAERFVARPGRWLAGLTPDSTDTRATASVVFLLVSVCLAGGILGFALATPTSGAEYSQLALYGEDENGTQTIGAVPDAIEPEGEIPLAIEVTNEHREHRNYTVVIQEQNVTDGTVSDRRTLERIEYELDAGASVREETTISPGAELGETVRIVALMYDTDRGAVPERPTRDNADDYVYFHTTITEDPDDDGSIVVDEDEDE